MLRDCTEGHFHFSFKIYLVFSLLAEDTHSKKAFFSNLGKDVV